MEEIAEALRKAESNLNDALVQFENPSSDLAQEFHALKIQACIFQFDVCWEMSSFLMHRPTGFAAAVALKGLVLRLYEYDQLQNKQQIPWLIELAKERNVPWDTQHVREARDRCKEEFKQLRGWSSVRNKAAGHYASDIAHQVELLKNLQSKQVFGVAQAFLQFNMSLLETLRDAGRGGSR